MTIGTMWYINIKGIIAESNWTVNNFFRWANSDNNYLKNDNINKKSKIKPSNSSRQKSKKK